LAIASSLSMLSLAYSPPCRYSEESLVRGE
jgi:hypothetical protein